MAIGVSGQYLIRMMLEPMNKQMSQSTNIALL
jgi:hypothetical protein